MLDLVVIIAIDRLIKLTGGYIYISKSHMHLPSAWPGALMHTHVQLCYAIMMSCRMYISQQLLSLRGGPCVRGCCMSMLLAAARSLAAFIWGGGGGLTDG
jgi:hypothetical protein